MKRGWKNMNTTAATTLSAMVVAVVLVFVTTCCSGNHEKIGALYSTEDFTVYPDSFVANDLLIAQRVDTLVVHDESKTWNASRLKERSSGAKIEGSDGLLVYLFNRETQPIEGKYDALTAYEIYIAEGLLNVAGAIDVVDSRIVGGEIAEIERGDYRWPVATADAMWGLAASTVSSMGDGGKGENARVKALERLVKKDLETVFDREAGLFCGVAQEMQSSQLPNWADAGDVSAMMTLSGNVTRLAAMQYVNRVLPESFDDATVGKLRDKISKRYWLPEEGVLSQTLYQKPYSEAVAATDNLAQATAVATASVEDIIAQRVVENTPMSEEGVPTTWPKMGIAGERRELLTTAMWAIASARVKNYAAWELSYGSLAGKSVYNEYALRLLQGVTLRTIIGLNPEADGLRFQPMVYDELGDYHRVRGLRYRDSELSVTIRGKGDVISSFTIDGELMAEAVVPKNLEGVHDVEIVLSGCSNVPNGVTLLGTEDEPEETKWRIHINGTIEGEIDEDKYEPNAVRKLTAVGIERVGGVNETRYASKYQLYIPKNDSVAIACTTVASTGGRVLAKKDLAAKHVESTRYKNSKIEFEYVPEESGEYYIRLRYLDGLGIVNKNRQYALRLLRVNGESQGVMVLPQRGPEKWTPMEDWSEMTGTTAPKLVELKAGVNKIAVEYFAPEGVADFDHDGNIVIPVALELIKR